MPAGSLRVLTAGPLKALTTGPLSVLNGVLLSPWTVSLHGEAFIAYLSNSEPLH